MLHSKQHSTPHVGLECGLECCNPIPHSNLPFTPHSNPKNVMFFNSGTYFIAIQRILLLVAQNIIQKMEWSASSTLHSILHSTWWSEVIWSADLPLHSSLHSALHQVECHSNPPLQNDPGVRSAKLRGVPLQIPC